MRIEHRFDRKGLFTALLLIAFCVIAGTALRFAYTHAVASGLFRIGSPAVAIATSSLALTLPADELALTTSTPERVINALTIPDVIPSTGKFIAADLVHMQLSLYKDGVDVGDYPILTKGQPGTPWETPAGFYSVETKEKSHFSSTGNVYMPYSMQFYGNYYIHGWPYYPDGTPVASTFSGGCIRLGTADAEQVFNFADKGTGLFVYDSPPAATTTPIAVADVPMPPISADSYLVADADTGSVYAERNAETKVPIASVTKLMTALVANETINFEQEIPIDRGVLEHPENATDTSPVLFPVGDLLYPLLMESNNDVANSLASYYGTTQFVDWMNATAHALDMPSTHFSDASGVMSDDQSTPDDLYRLAVYLADKKSFIWDITRTPEKTLIATDGSSYSFNNFNIFSDLDSFLGGKVGQTTPAGDTMVSLFSVTANGQPHRIVIVVLHSKDYASDTAHLTEWLADAAENSSVGTACVTCAGQLPGRTISL